MGRQQQFQVLKGVVRRTLLRRFHNAPPIFSHPHREQSSAAAEAEGGCVRLLSEVLSDPTPTPAARLKYSNPLCPSSYAHDPSSRRVFNSYTGASSEQNAPSKIGEFISPELLHHPPPPSSGSVSLLGRPHCSSAKNLLPAYYWTSFSSSAVWPVRVSALLAKKRLFQSSGSGGEGGGSRRFASLVGDSKNVEKVDEVVAQEGGAGREGQGGDEGVTASVSGREIPVAKKRRKRKSLFRGVELPHTEAPEGVPAKRRAPSEFREDEKPLDANSSSPPSIDNVVVKPIRAARKKRVNGECVLRDFSETVPPPPDTQVVQTPNRRKALASSEGTEKKPLEVSAFLKQPEFAETSLSVLAMQDGSVQGDLLGCGESKEGDHLSNGNEVFIPNLDNPADVQITPIEKEVGRPSVVTELVEEVLRKDTLNSPAVEVPAITDHIKAVESDSHRTVNDAAAAAAANGTNPAVNSFSAGVPESDANEFSNPQALYRTLSEGKGGRPYQNQEKSKLLNIFYRFAVSGWVSDQALSLYINSKFFPTAASRFRKFFMHKSSQELRSFVASIGPTNEVLQFLFPHFAEFCIHEFPNEISRYRELVNTADMTKPDAWYPFARAMKRKVVYHKGPTNSGKTYNALQRFMEASSGIYCSPLRLLAMEVFDTVNMKGVYCNLHTGQEKKDVPFANHLACTVEMCYLTRQWDVAVIDEIQMMSDEYRGWAWTRAFLGLQADEIHVCGDPSALPLIRNICNGTGDDLVEHEYQRFMPLKVSEESLRGDFRNIETGDCIVAFSRRDIFDIKREVELATQHRCCVVYGALPPETRTQQAKLFNEVDNGYNVLVASDAIGMGLNLNIRRVVFFSLDKFDGDSKKPVPSAQVKQIAGRAGRRNSLYPEGVTTTFFSQDLPYLGSSMLQDFEPAKASGLFPVFEQVELFASQLPNENFAKLLERFSETCKLDGAYFLSRYDNLKRVANMLEKVKGLSLEDRFNFCFAPVNVRDPQSMGALYRYATAFSQKIPVHVEMGVPSSSARDEFELLDLEARHQVLSMYLWLSQHFSGDLFPQREQAGEMASQIAVLLGQSLVQSSRRWSKRKLSEQQYRGRPFTNMGKPDSRKGTVWKDGKPKLEENFVRA